jgi:predicted RNA binding protein YcfA (HicA-like mRNA interferase family)
LPDGYEKYPPLTPDEVIKILASKGFLHTGTEGSHRQYEKGSRKVTVDAAMRDFGIDLMQSMIRQSGMDREEFYSATKATAKKINKRYKKSASSEDTDPAESSS